MIDVDCAVGDTPCLTAADDSGYEVDEAEVIYWGRCPDCVASASVSGDTSSATALDPEQATSRATSHQK